MKTIHVWVSLLVLVSLSCSLSASPVVNSASEQIALTGPQSFLDFSQQARNRGNYFITTGTVASVFQSSEIAETLGKPELKATVSGILSYEQLCARGAEWLCFNRHSNTTPVVPGISDPTNNVNALWVAVSMEGEPDPFIAFNTASLYAQKGVETRGWDLPVAIQKLEQAQSRLVAIQGGAVVAQQGEEAILSQYIAMETRRVAIYTTLSQNPEQLKLWNSLRMTPIVVGAEFSPAELAKRFEQGWQNGPGTRVKSGEIPLSRVSVLYLDSKYATPEVMNFLRGKGLKVEVVGEQIAQNANLWQLMPQPMYNFLYGVARAGEWVVNVGGMYLLAITPAGVKVADYMDVSLAYQVALDSQLNNFSEEEYYELHNDWLNQLAMIQDPTTQIPLFQPMFDMIGVDPSNPDRGGWSQTPWISVGQTANLDLQIREGNLEYVVGNDLIDVRSASVQDMQDVQVSFLGWTEAGPNFTWDGYPSQDYFFVGCTEYLDQPGMWAALYYDVRWSSLPDHSQIKVFSRPQVVIGSECITNITLP